MRRRAKVLVAPVLGLALTGYFAYHLVEGDRGLRAWMRTTQELRLVKTGLADVAAERAKLESRAERFCLRTLKPRKGRAPPLMGAAPERPFCRPATPAPEVANRGVYHHASEQSGGKQGMDVASKPH